MKEAVSSILIVEDNDDDVFFVQRALRRAGFELPLVVVNDGQQAIDYLAGMEPFVDRAMHPMPNLIFLDLKLPYQSGFEVLLWLRTNRAGKAPAVIVLTSSLEPCDLSRARELGASGYLVKPPTPEMLLQVFQALGDPLRAGGIWPDSLPGGASHRYNPGI